MFSPPNHGPTSTGVSSKPGRSLPSHEAAKMEYQVTVRYGRKRQRYLSLGVEAEDAAIALRQAADLIPEEIVPQVDIVELREAPDFDKQLPQNEGS